MCKLTYQYSVIAHEMRFIAAAKRPSGNNSDQSEDTQKVSQFITLRRFCIIFGGVFCMQLIMLLLINLLHADVILCIKCCL